MKIAPIKGYGSEKLGKISSGVVRTMSSTRDKIHYVISDNTAVGRFVLMNPRISIVAALTLATGLMLGAINLFKSCEKDRVVDKAIDMFDTHVVDKIAQDMKSTENAINNW